MCCCTVTIARPLLGKSAIPEDGASQVVHDVVFDASKSRELLGIQYHSKEETTARLLEEFKKAGC